MPETIYKSILDEPIVPQGTYEIIRDLDKNLSELDHKQQSNLTKLQQIAQLKDNWDGYGAEHFSEQLIHRAKYLIHRLYIQPEIFPTANSSLQIEYEKDNGDYLEFQFTGNGSCEGFMLKNGSEEYFHSQDNYLSINAQVEDFYGLHKVCIKRFSHDNSR